MQVCKFALVVCITVFRMDNCKSCQSITDTLNNVWQSLEKRYRVIKNLLRQILKFNKIFKEEGMRPTIKAKNSKFTYKVKNYMICFIILVSRFKCFLHNKLCQCLRLFSIIFFDHPMSIFV